VSSGVAARHPAPQTTPGGSACGVSLRTGGATLEGVSFWVLLLELPAIRRPHGGSSAVRSADADGW
jgi:hypothetical protein